MERNVRSPLERFAIPHQFQPRLSVCGAVIAISAALLQILLGSLIAALWGAGIWSSAASAHSALWKTFVIALDVAAMAASLAAMFWMVHKAAAHLDKKNAGGPSAASPAGL